MTDKTDPTQASTAITTTAANGKPPTTLRTFLAGDSAQARLREVATKLLSPTDLVRFALIAVTRNSDLTKCSHVSVLRALIDAAAIGIAPSGTMGRGYLVPRRNKRTGVYEACFDPGWRGLIDVACRTGKVRNVEAQVVYEADEFSYVLGLHPDITHRPALGVENRGAIVAAYAVVHFTAGGEQFEVMGRADLEKIRRTSAAQGENSPWKTWPEEMSRKSPVRRLLKYMPFEDALLNRALDLATKVDSGDGDALDEGAGSEEAEAPKTKQIAARIRARAAVDRSAAVPASTLEPCAICGKPIAAEIDKARTMRDDGTTGWRHVACAPIARDDEERAAIEAGDG